MTETDSVKSYKALDIADQLQNTADWLGSQHCNLTYGLASPEDGLKLHRHWMADDSLPEYADDWDDSDPATSEQRVKAERIAAVGYDPIERAQLAAMEELAKLSQEQGQY